MSLPPHSLLIKPPTLRPKGLSLWDKGYLRLNRCLSVCGVSAVYAVQGFLPVCKSYFTAPFYRFPVTINSSPPTAAGPCGFIYCSCSPFGFLYSLANLPAGPPAVNKTAKRVTRAPSKTYPSITCTMSSRYPNHPHQKL